MHPEDKINKYLNEKNVFIKNREWHNTVQKAASLCDWSSTGIAEFVYDLMTECNFHSEAKDISNRISKL